MAKISFTKVNTKIKTEPKIQTIDLGDGIVVEVKEYLPLEQKLAMFEKILGQCSATENYFNPIEMQVYLDFEVVKNYTNIKFSETQEQDIMKTYDALNSHGFLENLLNLIPEYHLLRCDLEKCAKAIVNYKNSFVGMISNMSKDFSNLSVQTAEIKENLTDPQNMTLLKDVLSKLG